MSRKVFISFLRFNKYAPCHYCGGGYKSAEMRFVQEAILDHLIKKEQWEKDSVALILLIKGTEKMNWEDDEHRNRNTCEVIK